MEILGKTAVVTGGAIRVGRAIALALARQGANIAISYRTSSKEARETIKELEHEGVKAIAIRADISKAADVKKLIQKVIQAFGSIEILVNNAAIFYKRNFFVFSSNGASHAQKRCGQNHQHCGLGRFKAL
ncbi:MAG: SDR family NAD(P)-dependent oxidoreductase [Chlamydiae bacterium]|nr:SDR family NAD(P)-dependent oxidoreductase [Chlamydiota bacterium]